MIVWRAVRFAAMLAVGTLVAFLTIVLLFLVWARVSLGRRSEED